MNGSAGAQDSVRRAVFAGAGRIDVIDEPLPSLAEGEVRIAVAASALCGSDLRLLMRGSVVTPGHEVAGTVVDVGPGVRKTKIGERGIVYAPVFCGTCDNCRSGLTNRCSAFRDLIGWQRPGGYATRVDVPAQCLIPIPDDIPMRIAPYALDTIGTTGYALRTASRLAGPLNRICILGCGAIGLGAVALTGHLGLAAPSIFDPVHSRLAIGASLGGVPITGEIPDGSFDLVIEASGSATARLEAQRLVASGGVVVVLGESEDDYVIPATARTRRTEVITLRTFYFPLRDIEHSWDFLRRYGDSLDSAIGSRAPFEEIELTFDAFSRRASTKPILEM